MQGHRVSGMIYSRDNGPREFLRGHFVSGHPITPLRQLNHVEQQPLFPLSYSFYSESKSFVAGVEDGLDQIPK